MYDYSQTQITNSKRKQKKTKKSAFISFIFILLILTLVISIKNQLQTDEKPISPTSNLENSNLSQNNSIQTQNQTNPSSKPNTSRVTPNPISINSKVNEVNELFANKQGSYGWYVQSLVSGEGYGSNYDFAYTAASINKIPIMISFLQNVESGTFSLDDKYTLTLRDIEEGSGTLQYQTLGSTWTYQQLVEFSGHYSDNTAINALHHLVGFDSPQRLVDQYNLSHTNINKNTSSPKDMVTLLSVLYSQKIIKDDLLNLFYKSLQNTEYEEDLIPEGVPDSVAVSHKIGWQIQVWSDCGIVFSSKPYALCIMDNNISETEAREIIPQISHKIWTWEGI